MNFLSKKRREIDQIDSKIIQLLKKRLAIVSRITLYKIKHQLPLRDLKREKEILQQRSKEGRKQGLKTNYFQDLFERILDESHHLQTKISRKRSKPPPWRVD